jgi:hypothetical protein
LLGSEVAKVQCGAAIYSQQDGSQSALLALSHCWLLAGQGARASGGTAAQARAQVCGLWAMSCVIVLLPCVRQCIEKIWGILL